MHDLDRVRDKIEVRLEPRQVVALGIGTMLFSGVLFAGGYYLGQHQAEPQLIRQTDATFVAAKTTPEETPSPPPVVAVGEVEFLFPTALGSRPARPKKARRSMRLPADVVRGGKAENGPTAAWAKPAPVATSPPPVARPPDPPAAPAVVTPPVPAPRLDDEDAPSAMGGTSLPKADGDALGAAVSGDKDGPLRPADVTSPVKSPVPVAPPSITTAKTPPSLSPKPSPSPSPETAPSPPIKSAVVSTVVAAETEAPKPAPAPPSAEDAPAETPVSKPAVEVETPPKKAAVPPKKKPAAAPSRVYTLQVKAARDKVEADTFVKALRAKGFKPHLILVDIPKKGRFYRVRLGRFDSMPEARAFQRRYKATSGQPDGGFVTDL